MIWARFSHTKDYSAYSEAITITITISTTITTTTVKRGDTKVGGGSGIYYIRDKKCAVSVIFYSLYESTE